MITPIPARNPHQMHARFDRGIVLFAAIAATVTGTLAWAPAVTAQPSTPTPHASDHSETPAREAGSISITKKDMAGGLLAGASFLLLDSAGQGTGRGKTDAQGRLSVSGLAPGVYRLKEISSRSPQYGLAADQDVIVAPGQVTSSTVIDPFKPAALTVRKSDRTSGKPLAGAVISITPSSGGATLTVTTGKDGTATAQLPVSSRTGTSYMLTEMKAPVGYLLDAQSARLTAHASAPVTVTLTDTPRASQPSPRPRRTQFLPRAQPKSR